MDDKGGHPRSELRLVLGHGASGTAESMRPHVEGLRARGVDAVAIDLPRGNAEAAVRVFETRASAADALGGHSYGGRVASLLASRRRFTALVLFSYPLHRPGRSDWEARTAHWPHIGCPVLLLSGESDPFARIALLRLAVQRLPHAQLVTYPGVGHGIGPVLEDALDRVANFIGALPAEPLPEGVRALP
ncbi:MAG: alpha/beta hydrolase [Chloroflexota bacterium]|nr:alpha/beta hydrolase [Chloroflexota bacterium]